MVQEAIATAKEQSVRFFSREGFLNKRGVGFVLGAAILIVAMCIPGSEAISRQGIMGIASLLFAVVFWVCGTLPLGVSGILALIIAVLTGAGDDLLVIADLGERQPAVGFAADVRENELRRVEQPRAFRTGGVDRGKLKHIAFRLETGKIVHHAEKPADGALDLVGPDLPVHIVIEKGQKLFVAADGVHTDAVERPMRLIERQQQPQVCGGSDHLLVGTADSAEFHTLIFILSGVHRISCRLLHINVVNQ